MAKQQQMPETATAKQKPMTMTANSNNNNKLPSLCAEDEAKMK